MTIDRNREVVLKYAQSVWNERDYDVADELISPAYQHHSLGYSGPEGLKKDIASVHNSFPDGKWDLLDTIAEGDKVTLRFRFRGTHQAKFAGVEPTHKQVDINAIAIYRLQDHQIVEEWTILDFFTMLKQMGQV